MDFSGLFDNIKDFVYTWNCIKFELALEFGFFFESILAEFIPYNYKKFKPVINRVYNYSY